MKKIFSDRRVWLVMVLLILAGGITSFVWSRDDSVGYTVPTDISVYGITGKETVYGFSEYMELDPERIEKIEVAVFDDLFEKNEEQKHTLLSLTEKEKIRSCMAFLDESFEIVDLPVEYCAEARFTTWPPYQFTFSMYDGTDQICAVSVIDEPSRIIEKDGAYREMLTTGDVFTQLLEKYGMAAYP